MIYRILGFILGFIFLGDFWGGLFGYFVGALINTLIHGRRRTFTFDTFTGGRKLSQDDFVDTLMQLTAVVIKADNRFVKSELNFVKEYLIQNLGANKAQNAILSLRDYINKEIDTETLCNKLRHNTSLQERLLILQFLFGLAQSDGNIDQNELNSIQMIASWMGISTMDFEAIKSMFLGYSSQNNYYDYYSQGYSNSNSNNYSSSNYNNLDNDYKILEISSDATDDEVKKAYRKAAMKHHPDKVSHLGEEVRKAAEEKFARLNEAYERIKKSRGMN